MTTQTIEVEGLPEGWKAVAYRYAYGGEHVLGDDGVEQVRNSVSKTTSKRLIVEKIQPRRIVLEETEEVFSIRKSGYRVYDNGIIQYIENAMGPDIDEKIWRQVKE